MAGLNLLMLFWRGALFYYFRDLHAFFSWHILVWAALGLFLGIILFLLSFIIGRISHVRIRQLAAAAVVVAVFLSALSYLNIYSLGYIFSLATLLINSFGILVMAAAVVVVIPKSRNISKWIILAPAIVCFLIWSSSWLANKTPRTSAHAQNQGQGLSSFNVILLVLDAVRADHLGCYGYQRDTSPHIDDLASKGILFSSAFSHAGRTYMSVPSLLTSTFPSTHGVINSFSCLPRDCPTLPSYFRLAGYSTAIFSTNPYISTTYGYDSGVDDLYEPVQNELRRTFFGSLSSYAISAVGLASKKFSSFASRLLESSFSYFASDRKLARTDPEFMTTQMVSWISRHQDSRFFIYAHLEGGHMPYRSPLVYKKLFSANDEGRQIDNPFLLTPQEKEKLDTREIERMVALYDAKIRYHDDQLSRLFEYLEAAGLDQETIVVITADHGEEFGEHGGFTHSNLYSGTIRVPLVFYSPRLFPEPRSIDALIGHVDLLPTLISLAGLADKPKLDRRIEGLDFSTYLRGVGDPPCREYIFSELNVEDRRFGMKIWRSILSRSFQAIQVHSGSLTQRMLFDLAGDPEEKTNIYQENSEVDQHLFEIMDSVYQLSISKSFKTKKIHLEENIKEKLKSLGYVH